VSVQSSTIVLALSAGFVGLVHSLAPGHWLPVVLMAKARRWHIRTAVLGALAAATGHIVISNGLGLVSIFIGFQFLPELEHDVERYASLILVVFGLGYAAFAYFRHWQCHGHTHHGPKPAKTAQAFLFLFSLGFSPCLAVVPIIATAATKGSFATILTMFLFSVGVVITLITATVLTALGIMKLDHPVLEHYGDVLAGIGIAVMGIVLFIVPI